LAAKLIESEERNDPGILGEVARALRSLNELSDITKAPPLDIAQLRGGVYRDRGWARSLTQPMVVCTTADQLGSRLLFRGYGVTDEAKPIHAALCGCDSLVLLDEAHVTRAFSQTMGLLTRYQNVRTNSETTVPPMRFVQMTATPAGEVTNRFGLEDEDRQHPILKARQQASKLATLVAQPRKKSLANEIVDRAFEATSDTRKAVGIIVNRVQTARDVARLIQEEIDKRSKDDESFDADIHLVIGRMRPIDRDDLQAQLRTIVGPDRPEVFPVTQKPVFIVATQCLEVGADYDFDALITEAASIDALRQRFGRLNRKGRPIDVVASILATDDSLKGDDPIYGDAIKHTWDWLQSKKNEKDQVDFGIAAFKPLWDEVEREHATYLDDQAPNRLLSPTQNAAVLLPAHLDSLCQTNPQPVPSPDVSYFIHGPQRDNAEVNVCWRADLGEDQSLWPDIVRLLPPTSIECMTVPLRDVRRWMIGDNKRSDRDADVPVQAEVEDDEADSMPRDRRPVVVWRGLKQVIVTDIANQLRPNDTLVLPVEYRNWNTLGHVPLPKPADYAKRNDENEDQHAARCFQLDRTIDVAERATRRAKLRVVVRIHPAFAGTEELRGLSDSDLRVALIDRALVPTSWNTTPVARIQRHAYRDPEDDGAESAPDEVIVFKRLLDPPNRLDLPIIDEDDGEDDLSEGNKFISLDCHTMHVVDQLRLALDKLPMGELEASVRASAPLHDLGKADSRFQAMLAGVTPYEAMMFPNLLAKGDGERRTKAERQAIRDRAMYPNGFRHEMLSVEIIEHLKLESSLAHLDLLLHLIAAHHGCARPFAPVYFDDASDDELRSLRVNGNEIPGDARKAWTPSHRLDSGIAERFWDLTRAHGWWGLAYLEAILRLADCQASAAERGQSSAISNEA
jgi:CRISPR-associated endonuclease/helicase Cas3